MPLSRSTPLVQFLILAFLKMGSLILYWEFVAAQEGCQAPLLTGVPSGVEDRAQPHDRGPLLDGDLPVLAGAHREAWQAVLAGELGQASEIRP